MATLGELKARIIRETNRDELADTPGADATAASSADLEGAIRRAIEFYAAKRFWFNETSGTTVTTIGSSTAPAPAGLRVDDYLDLAVGGQQRRIARRDLHHVNALLGYGVTRGEPYDYARDGSLLRLYPIPRQVYTLTVFGLYDLTALDSDAASNAWTTEAEDLIAARTRFLLLRDTFRDPEGAGMARSAEDEALAALRGESAQRAGTGRVRAAC